MTDDLVPKAINAALKNNWEEAIRLNLSILSRDKENADALNRLAFAYLQHGNPKKAKIVYKQAVSIDPYNEIAKKNLAKINALKKGTTPKNNLKEGSSASNTLFIEEPGKTKCVTLVKIATPSILSCLCPGEEARLVPKRHSMVVVNQNDVYLGALPDDIGYKISKRQRAGNKYQAYIKFAGKNSLSVFIRETARCKRFRDQPTFLTTPPSDYYSSVREEATVNELQKSSEDNSQEDSSGGGIEEQE